MSAVKATEENCQKNKEKRKEKEKL